MNSRQNHVERLRLRASVLVRFLKFSSQCVTMLKAKKRLTPKEKKRLAKLLEEKQKKAKVYNFSVLLITF